MFDSNQISKSDSLYDQLFNYAHHLGFGELHMKIDKKTGLFALIAIHSTKLGPAIGGCRFLSYNSTEDAIRDVFRLGQMMSYKAAICGMNHGGAKSVIIKPDHIDDREALLESFGDFVNEMNGRYIAAVDSGSNPTDMDIIARRTPFVTCTTESYQGHGDVSYYTALGVRRGLEAAVKFKYGRDDVKDLHVAIQGVGNVGYYLAKQLHEMGAKLTVCDREKSATERCMQEFGATVVGLDDIYTVDCDIFAPCALGATVNEKTIPTLKANIVVGSANNQLVHPEDSILMQQRDILYAPDFVVNSGGLIHVAALYDHGDETQAHSQIQGLYETMLELFERAKKDNKPTNFIAEVIARERLDEDEPIQQKETV